MSAQVAADLRAAAEVLERDGWVQGEYVTESGECCAVGALVRTVDPSLGHLSDLGPIAQGPRVQSALASLVAVVKFDDPTDAVISSEGLVARYNDEDGRTADEVIAALRAAADRAEADQ